MLLCSAFGRISIRITRHALLRRAARTAAEECVRRRGFSPRRRGFSPGAKELRRRLGQADAFVISSPEYNFSMPGALKNVIDWVSRYGPQPFKGKHCLLMSASPSMAGGNRGLWALR
jgi:NAD(P)H-dependent FMN reductase